MNELNEEKFRKFWEQTKLVRTYKPRLSSYLDIDLPYIFLSQHPELERVFVKKGKVYVKKPAIIIPGVTAEFEGFEYGDEIKRQVAILTRMIRLPYYKYSHKAIAEEIIERYDKEMEKENDEKTGLIIGNIKGWSISLARYSFEVATKSAPENIKELLERVKRKEYPPIASDEEIPDNPWDLF